MFGTVASQKALDVFETFPRDWECHYVKTDTGDIRFVSGHSDILNRYFVRRFVHMMIDDCTS
jgi:hypothetical protein